MNHARIAERRPCWTHPPSLHEPCKNCQANGSRSMQDERESTNHFEETNHRQQREIQPTPPSHPKCAMKRPTNPMQPHTKGTSQSKTATHLRSYNKEQPRDPRETQPALKFIHAGTRGSSLTKTPTRKAGLTN